MSVAEQPRFHPDRPIRRLLGPIFGAACLVATCTGVVVLALLLGSIVAAALQGPPINPWYAIGANASELATLIRRLAAASQSLDPRSTPRWPDSASGSSAAFGSSGWLR
jgi:phosphate transport system permease protein